MPVLAATGVSMRGIMMPPGLVKAFAYLGAGYCFFGLQAFYLAFGACLIGWLLDMDSF
jgi:hypothetical protein